MEILLLLLAIPAFLIFYPLYVGHRVSQLEQRVRELEAQKNNVAVSPTQQQMAPPPAATPASPATAAAPSDQFLNTVTPSQQPGTFIPNANRVSAHIDPPPENAFMNWAKQDFFVKVGALLLLLACGWFVSYAFANNWIGPAGRIALGMLFGVTLMCLGVWRIPARVHQGSIFTVVGAASVLMTVYAARSLYDFFTPATALGMMFLAVAFVAFVSVRYQREQLAIAGVLLGAVAPLFTNSPDPDVFGLFTYLLVVIFGTVWVVALTGWSRLTSVALLTMLLYSIPFFTDGVPGAEKDIALIFTFIFVAIFMVTNVTSILRRVDPSHLPAQIFTAIGTSVYLIAWIQLVAAPEWQSLLYVVWALVFGVGAFIVERYSRNLTAFYLYGASAAVMIGAATAAELSGPVLTIAYIIEIGVILIVANALQASTTIIKRICFLFLVPVLLSLESLGANSWNTGYLHDDSVVLMLLAVVLGMVATVLFYRDKAEGTDMGVVTTLYVGSSLYAISLVWLVLHAAIRGDAATTLALMIYTVFGLLFFVVGKVRSIQALKIGGGILIGLVVARLLLVEVWDMSLGGRIVTFFVIGIMLISTAFIKEPKKTNHE